MNSNAEEEAAKLQKERVAAETIALGYNCEIISIDDTHVQPDLKDLPPNVANPNGRTTINVTFHLEKRPEAAPYFEEYKDDTAVQWYALRPGGNMHFEGSDGTTPITVSTFNPELSNQQADGDIAELDSQDVTIQYFPRTNYPNGTYVDLKFDQKVITSDGENIYETTGIIPCGTMEIYDGTWGKSAIPTTLNPSVHTETGKWQKTE